MKNNLSPFSRFKELLFGISNICFQPNCNSGRKSVTIRSLFRFGILLLFIGIFSSSCHAGDGLKIYYIRHAEGGHNVKKNWETYSEISEDQWPAYVGDPNVFTPMGKGQLAQVSGKLKKYKFDFIASSPIWRTRNTILPYMKEVGATGEVWPELCEYWQSPLILSSDLPPPTVKILGEGVPVELPAEERPYFSLREDGQNHIKLPPFPKDPSLDNVTETAASQLVIQHVLDMIQKRFGGTNTNILLAGHGFSGRGILRMLLKDELRGFPNITNTGIWMVEEQANGEFKLMMFNDVPLETGN